MPQKRHQNTLLNAAGSLIVTLFAGLFSFIVLCLVFALLLFCLMTAYKTCNPLPALHNTAKNTAAAYPNKKAVTVLAAKITKPVLNMHLPTPSRLVLYAADIRMITGCSKRSSQRQMMALKEKFKRQAHQYITIEEYCTEKMLNYQKILQQLKLI